MNSHAKDILVGFFIIGIEMDVVDLCDVLVSNSCNLIMLENDHKCV